MLTQHHPMEKETLYKFFAGKATAAERHSIREWAEASDANRKELFDERRIYDLFVVLGDQLGDFGEAPGATASKKDAVTRPAARQRRLAPRFLRRAGYIAAACLLAFVAIFADRLINPRADAEASMQTLTVPAGQRLNITLADGTSVWLNSCSKMIYPGVFGRGKRMVTIDGEAYLEVAHDSSRPFTVKTSVGQVEVTGTKFNVDAYTASNDFAVSLVEGSVLFHAADSTYAIKAGSQLTRLRDGRFATAAIDTITPDWVRGIISFEDQSLSQILARFEKYYGVKVNYCLPDVANQRFSGKFYLDDGIEHALNALKHDIDFSFIVDKDNRSITIR